MKFLASFVRIVKVVFFPMGCEESKEQERKEEGIVTVKTDDVPYVGVIGAIKLKLYLPTEN